MGNIEKNVFGEKVESLEATKIDSIRRELTDFSADNKIPKIEDRIRRGLDPVGIIALEETNEKVRNFCQKNNIDYEEVKKMVLNIQLNGPWEYSQQIKKAEDPVVKTWIMLNAANTVGKEREMDLTSEEFLKDIERINSVFKDADNNPSTFFEQAKEHVLEKSKERFRVENGVPISEMDNGFIAMAINGYDAGIIQDADGLLFVGAKSIDESIFKEWNLTEEERDDGRGHKATFYVNDRKETIIKKLHPGFLIVLSRNFELAKAIIQRSRNVDSETLGHNLYRPTSLKREGREKFSRIKKNRRIKKNEENSLENLTEEERKRKEFYNYLAFIKTQQTFRDRAISIIRKNKEKGMGRVTNDTLETEVDKTKKKLEQKINELKYMISVMDDELNSLPSDVNEIVDMAGGAGDLGLAVSMEMFLRGKELKHTYIIDPEEDLAMYNKYIIQELPNSDKFKEVVKFKVETLQDAEISNNAVVVAKHPCGDLTDIIIEKWVQSKSPLLVIMTCCQEKAAERPARYNISQDDWQEWCKKSARTNVINNPQKLKEGVDAMTKLDNARVNYLQRYGFDAKLFQNSQFPKGDIILAKRKIS
jgi:hypothetical protein